jgi:hypothetical protein
MSGPAALLLVAAIAAAGLLIRPALERTGLGMWHPAVAWLVLSAVFFGIGSAVLALDGRPGPAVYVAGAVLVFAAAVAAGDRLARRRATLDAVPGAGAGAPADPVDLAPLRPAVVAGFAALGLALIAPTLLRVGLPFLAGDITGARAELAGLSVQVLRVAVPALALALVFGSSRAGSTATTSDTTRRRQLGWLAVALLVALELVLASRYLAVELVAIVLVGVGLAGWDLRPRRLAALALVAVLAFGGIQVLRAYDQAAGREFAFAIERTVNRVVLIQPRTLEALQAAIPAEQPYFGGLTWVRRLGPAIGRPDIPNLGYWIYPRLFPGQEPPGYAAPGVIGEAWANFGPAGLALIAVLGLLAERLGAFLSRRRRAVGDLVAGTMLLVFLARTHALGVNGLLVLVVIVVAWRCLGAGGLTGTWRTVRDVLAWRA